MEHVIEKHGGMLLTPPYEKNRVKDFKLTEEFVFEIEGKGWLNSCCDIVFPGIGWIAFTGSGKTKVTIKVPKKITPILRSPLMPFEAQTSVIKYQGLGTL